MPTVQEVHNMADKTPPAPEELSIHPDAHRMIEKARRENVETVWDRLDEQKPACKFCETGLTCKKCTMGPCRLTPDKDKRQRGVCGADADVTVARNFGRFVAGGAAAHSDHGRDLVETLLAIGQGKTRNYEVRDTDKLRRIASEIGLEVQGKDDKAVAFELAEAFIEDFGFRTDSVCFVERVPEKRRRRWEQLGVTPRGVDRDVVEMMHRTHMGVDSDAASICLHAVRVSLTDGWGGSMIATELSDIIFGTPKPNTSKVNLGVLKEKDVNVLVHGHSPIVSEMILAVAREPAMVEKAKAAGAEGINVAGLCCTGNELLMRQGIPMAGNHLMTELALVTGAVDLMVVDYQCIMPSLTTVADCYQTRFVSTSEKAKFTGGEHVEFDVHNAREQSVKLVDMAIDAFGRRDPNRVDIPAEPVELMSGFSNEAILEALGGTPEPLLEAIKAGKVRGAVGVVGCNNPRLKHDHVHTELCKELIKRDVLVLVTGCAAIAMGKVGLMVPDAARMAGDGLRSVCESLGIPPVLHSGSCVDNSRIIHLCAVLADALGVDIADLPVAASAPEWYSEKAASIGLYAVSSGIYTHLGLPPHITGSEMVTNLALSGLEDLVGAAFAVESDPHKAADLIDERIKAKRKGLGLEP
jgi:carbon-monoxide dehydrogenase catalytic subunit